MATTTPHVEAVNPHQNDGFDGVDWALFFGIALIWGSSFLLIAQAIEGLSPGIVTFGRVALGCATLWIIKAIRKSSSTGIDRADWGRIVALSLLWVAIPFTLFPIAEQHVSSALTGLLNGSTPIFVAIFSVILTRTVPSRLQLIGLATGFVGVVLISAPALTEGSSQAFGVVLVLAASLCYGVAINLASPLQARYGSLPVMRAVLTVATVFLLPVLAWGLAGDNQPTAHVVWPVIVLGVVGTGLAYWIMVTLVARVGPVRASFITYLIPVVALVLGVAIRGDRVSPIAVGGVVLVIAGAFVASRRS